MTTETNNPAFLAKELAETTKPTIQDQIDFISDNLDAARKDRELMSITRVLGKYEEEEVSNG